MKFRRPAVAAACLLTFLLTTGVAPAQAASPRPAPPAAATKSPAGPRTYSYTTTVHRDLADVYHPARSRGRLPVVLLLQGAKVDRAFYSQYARAVASFGFAVVVPNHWRPVFNERERYAAQEQLAHAVAWARSENGRADSPLAGRIDSTSLLLLGHSFGGAAGLSATEGKCAPAFCSTPGFVLPREVKAASFYGTNNGRPGQSPAIANTVPVQLVQGTADGVAAPASAESTFSLLQHGPRQIVRLTGANHYGITDIADPPPANPDPTPQEISRRASIKAAARWAALFFRASLGDRRADAFVWHTGDRVDPAVTVTGRRR